MASAPVVLLTDFGWGAYVGAMKGMILRHRPDAVLIDLDHGVSPQNVREGAWLLLANYRFFPAGAVFVAVVDPGVGSERPALAVRAGDYYFVGPDNGLLYPAACEAGLRQIVSLPIPAGASPTFHGRDVFSPAAGRLAAGVPLEQLGQPLKEMVPLTFHLEGREGEVVTVDRFGNIVTNLPPLRGRTSYRVTIRRAEKIYFQRELPVFPFYAAAPRGIVFVVEGSSTTLELSVREESAARLLGAAVGDRIAIE